MRIQSAITAVVSVLLPAPCRLCDQPLGNVSRLPICADCLDRFTLLQDPICEICGRPYGAMSVSVTESRFLCRLCSAGTYAFERARSVAIYDDVAQRAIVLLKHHEVTRLGEWFAGRLAEMIKRHPEEFDMDVVVPVPLHRARHRARGYNQAELIAKPLARRLNLPCEPDLLVRTKPRPRKLVLSRKERWKSVRGAYEAATPAKVNERRVLVVDDAFTTGATIDACARALKKVGAAGVIGITFARTIFRAS